MNTVTDRAFAEETSPRSFASILAGVSGIITTGLAVTVALAAFVPHI
jgi:hypothetical protein